MANGATKRAPARNTRSRSLFSEHHRTRLKRLRQSIKAEDCEGLLVTNPKAIRYLTPFSGEDSALIVQARGLTIVSDTRFEEELEPLRADATLIMRKGPMPQELATALSGLNLQRVALQGEHMTAATRDSLARAIGAKRLVLTSGIVDTLRRVKDESEIKLIRKAASIQQQAMLALIPQLEPGLTEVEVAAILEFEMRRRGSEGPSFETIAAARANGSKPHARPGSTKLAAGKTLLIDWGARYQGYCSDMTRVFSFSKWPPPLRDAYQVTLEAFHDGVAAVKPGALCRDVDAAAREVIDNSRFAGRFVHSLGHAIGLDVHESPRLSKQSEDILEPGNVVTIEPGIYLPGVGGIRIEDDILVTPTGRRNLCTLPKDLEWATL